MATPEADRGVAWLAHDLTADALYRTGIPFDLFGELRDERPVWRHRRVPTRRAPDGVGFWAVLGHPEVQAVGRDWQTYSSVEGLSITPTAPENRGTPSSPPILPRTAGSGSSSAPASPPA